MARKKAESLPPLSDTLLPAEKGDVLALDELWSGVGSKANPRRLWITLGRQTRPVVAYFVGDRSADGARTLRERMPSGYRGRTTRSDLWLASEEVFPRRTHCLCGKAEGETCYVERWNCPLRQRLGRFVRRTLCFPSASGCTKSPRACSCIITTSHSACNPYPKTVFRFANMAWLPGGWKLAGYVVVSR